MKAQTQQAYIDTLLSTLKIEMQSEMTKRIAAIKRRGGRSPAREEEENFVPPSDSRIETVKKDLKALIESKNGPTEMQNLACEVKIHWLFSISMFFG